MQRAYLAHLAEMTEEIIDKSESLKDSTFLRSECVDSFGQRMAHLNGLVQVLTQLGGVGEAATVREHR